MSDYIKRKDAIEACGLRILDEGISSVGAYFPSANDIREAIIKIPSADVIERPPIKEKCCYCPICDMCPKDDNSYPDVSEHKTGEWKHTMTYYPYCSECEWMPEEDEMTHGYYNYCPNCGAKMGGEEYD